MGTEILPRLWIGDQRDAHDPDFLRKNHIKVIINCTCSLSFQGHYPCRQYRIPVQDNLQPDQIRKMYHLLDQTVKIIHHARLKLDPVLIHCHQGKQRSATIIVAYLMKYGLMSLNESIFCLRLKRHQVFQPRVNFIEALRKYELDLGLKNN